MMFATEICLQPSGCNFTLSNMTVIFAAICSAEKAVVLAADRAVTFQTDVDQTQIDLQEPKIVTGRGGIAICVAGRADQGVPVIRKVQDMTLAEIPDKVRAERDALREKEIQEFRRSYPNCGNSDEEILRKLNPWSLEFLIAGIDSQKGPIIWAVGEKGAIESSTYGGQAIGSGKHKAIWALLRRPDLADQDLATVVYAVFEAKKDAEATPGISKATDLVIIQEGILKPVFLGPSKLAPLQRTYAKMRPTKIPPSSLQHIRDLLGMRENQ